MSCEYSYDTLVTKGKVYGSLPVMQPQVGAIRLALDEVVDQMCGPPCVLLLLHASYTVCFSSVVHVADANVFARADSAAQVLCIIRFPPSETQLPRENMSISCYSDGRCFCSQTPPKPRFR